MKEQPSLHKLRDANPPTAIWLRSLARWSALSPVRWAVGR